MSIATSAEERAQAIEKLAAAPGEQLERDLAYWSVAKVDHQDAYRVATEARARAGELYAEADAWQDLIADELHRRRSGGAA